MATIVCDKCEARFETPVEAGGSTVYCPKCGAANGVPGGPGGPVAGGASATAPGTEEPERIVLRVRPALFRARPLLYSLVVTITLAGLIGGAYFLYNGQHALAAACALAFLCGGGYWLAWKIQKMMTSMEITTRRTVVYRGLLSKASTEVRHTDIKNFQITQSFLNRVFRVGHIGISSSGQDEIEIRVRDVPNPYRVRESIDRYRRE